MNHNATANGIPTESERVETALKIPRRVIVTDALPRSETGKLLKRELRETYSS